MNLPEALPPEAATSAEAALEELRRQIAVLIEAVAARDTFIAVAAHELRNPMTPIIGQIDLLLANLQAGRYSSAQLEHRVRRIRGAMDHFIKRAGRCWTSLGLPAAASNSFLPPVICLTCCERLLKTSPTRLASLVAPLK